MSMQLIPGKPINNPAVTFFIKQIHPRRIMHSLLPQEVNKTQQTWIFQLYQFLFSDLPAT